ncbi:MAG TPA: hypothetical protein VM282_25215 [Acidimicrobiales bacterium]|nr:hypothetical protein [Acidimicrobiales bacterium]
MSLNVREIEAHKFAMVGRGCDPEEVRSYLRQVATSMKDAPGRAYGDAGERVAGVFESAEKAAAEIKDAAEREAEAMRREADTYVSEQRALADMVLRDAEELAAAKVADADAHHDHVRSEADHYAETTRAEADRVSAELKDLAERDALQQRLEIMVLAEREVFDRMARAFDALRGAPDIDGLSPQAALPESTANGGYNQNDLDR